MTPTTELWDKVQTFEFDEEGVLFSFRDRLSKENHWSAVQSERAIEEYRRFLYLAATSKHPISPPDAVDQVWHLHLLYTRSYWDRLCDQTLGTRLHHDPTRGGAEETGKFADWYNLTIISYRDAFGESPPADLWPAAGIKSSGHDFQRVDLSKNWLLPKLKAVQLAMISVVVLAILALASACDRPRVDASDSHYPITHFPLAEMDNPFEYRGSEFLSFYTFVLVLAFVVAMAMRWQARRAGNVDPERINLGPYEAAYLRGGGALAIRAALAGLVSRGLLQFDPVRGQFSQIGITPKGLHPLESVALRTAANPASLRKIEHGTAVAVQQIETELVDQELVIAPSQRTIASVGIVLLIGVLIVGVIKIIVGISRDRPVGFLLLLTGLTFVITAVLISRRLHRTTAGEKAVQYARSKHVLSKEKTPVVTDDATLYAGSYGYHPMSMMYALYGMEALSYDPSLHHLRGPLAPTNQATGTSGGCGSSCSTSGGSDGGGGSSGSSGCGGCGGGGD